MESEDSHKRTRTGLERVVGDCRQMLRGRRFGLLANQASIGCDYTYAWDLLAQEFPGQLRAIFSPQHGLYGEQQANMFETPHGVHRRFDLPVYSLYSESRTPSSQMLREIDVLVVDLQDVGTRVYTFVWTMMNCLQACADHDIEVMVLDRPNPLGGRVVEGPILNSNYRSFVGQAEIPMRHGLTVGELSVFVNEQYEIGANLCVVVMHNWRRDQLFLETGLPWASPSPNMPSFHTAIVYPGQVMLEGTNLSEGRGTTLPFQLVGAPFIDEERLADELRTFQFAGIAIRPTRFVPMFDKFASLSCGGIAIDVVSPSEVRSFYLTLAIILSIRKLFPDGFEWLPPPYEYERTKMPIDILYGNSKLRLAVDAETSSVSELADVDHHRWWQAVAPFLLYE